MTRLGLFLPRRTPFYEALLPQMAAGFRAAGFDVHAGIQVLDEEGLAKFCADFRPDVVFEMNRTRRDVPSLPDEVKHIAWIVDFQGRRDDDIAGSEITYFFDPFWRRVFRYRTFSDWLPPGTSTEVYHPYGRPPPEATCDVSFLGHIPRPWSEAELARNVSRTGVPYSFGELLAEYLHHRRVAQIVGRDSEGAWDHTRLFRFASALVEAKTGGPITADPVIAYDLLGRVPRLGNRASMLDEAMAVTKDIRIWGSETWRDWPRFAPHYRGFLSAPEDLRRTYAGSRINLHEGVGMHFRALDCLAAGGLLFYCTETKSTDEGGGWSFPGDVWGYGQLLSAPRGERHYVEYYPGEFAEKARYYLERPADAGMIRRAARAEIEAHHTWLHRALKVARDLAYVERRRTWFPPKKTGGDAQYTFESPESPQEGETCVFYVSSHGSAGDHWFDWFARSLNAHPDLMIYMGESVRSKYLKERSRKDRPDLLAFTEFLTDLGKPYSAIGECYAYRAYQLAALQPVHGDRVRFVNIVRHPYCWLSSYVGWRATNMGMPLGQTGAIDHEWSVTRHDEFAALGLEPYTREDVSIWASHQGMHILNRMISDDVPGLWNQPLEQIVTSRDNFCELVRYLTHGRVSFDRELLDRIFGWVHKPFRVGGRVVTNAPKLRAAWPDWKVAAWDKLVSPQVRQMFASFGYDL